MSYNSDSNKQSPFLKKPKTILGKNLIFRNATTEDAAFIFELRTDEKKSTHISKTSPDIKHQEIWLQKYDDDCQQVYFIILNKDGENVGTVRLYDIQGDSFCWGSWILKEGTPSVYAIESAMLVYYFALSLGFKKAHFDVRKGNESVWKFHERFGAQKIAESDTDYFYNISYESIMQSLGKYKKYSTNTPEIEY